MQVSDGLLAYAFFIFMGEEAKLKKTKHFVRTEGKLFEATTIALQKRPFLVI